jgi:hypothetical protein
MANTTGRLQCWRHFLEKEYLKSYNSAAEAMTQGSHNELIQLSIISLQRLRRDDLVRLQLPLLFSVISHDNWLTLLLKLTAGEIESRKVFESAVGKQQLCQAHYYAYQRFQTLGDSESAAIELTQCLEQKADKCIEFLLAEAEDDGRESSSQLWRMLREVPT